MSVLTINTDGGARGNPGPAAIGVVFAWDGGEETYESCIGEATNNVAEYKAVLAAVERIPAIIGRAANTSSIQFNLDSELVVKQITGVYRIKEPSLQAICSEIMQHLRELKIPYSFSHVPRAQNKAADKLVNHALDNGIAA